MRITSKSGTEYELKDLLWLGFFCGLGGFTFGLGFTAAMAVTSVLSFLIRGAP